MRQETNNEIDLLLRRLSRRQGVPVSDGDSHNGSDHLDADELSSYAENALPAAARTRYTAHLAECSRCRELVVQLSASVPVVAAKQSVTAAGPSVLRKFLASFFSPMVLRYAVPALGVIVVAAIGFVVLRSGSRRESVARLNENLPTTASESVQNQQEQSAAKGFQDSRPQAAAKPAAGDTSGDVAEPVAPSATPAAVADRTQTKAVEAPAPKTETAAVANEPPPPAPKPSATVDEMRVDVEGRKPAESVHPTPGTEMARQRVENFRDKDAKKPEELQAASPRRAAKTGAAQAAPQGAGATGTSGTFSIAEEREKEKDKDDGVIRSVGGRRFRRQSGTWVDTAYDSGSAIVNVRRDSEQYKALVADEPDIKKIADQLDGPVIVVWKGRTYRIR